MVIDMLTKLHGNPQALHKLLDTGMYTIMSEDNRLSERAQLRATGRVKPR